MPIGKREPRPEKVQAVNEIREMVTNSAAVILTDYQSLDMKSLSALRKKVREAGGSLHVVKNSLFELAVRDTAAQPLAEGLVGPTAIVCAESDPVAAAKSLQDFAKGPRPLKVKSGIVDGVIYNPKQIEALASIPPKEQLYAMVVGGLQSPITNLVGTLNSMIGQLVLTLQAVADKKAAA